MSKPSGCLSPAAHGMIMLGENVTIDFIVAKIYVKMNTTLV